MPKCNNCGETDLIKSDICGDYCVYCLNMEDPEDIYKLARQKYKDKMICYKCEKEVKVKHNGMCYECYMEAR